MPASSGRFSIIYAPVVREHLRAIEPKFYSLIRDAIAEQLTFDPATETRNRKPLKRPVLFMATWEIRFGPHNQFRVFYDVDLDEHQVTILAIGRKHGNRVVIGNEESPL